MKRSRRILSTLLIASIAVPVAASAQAQTAAPPATRFVTVTRFAFPDDTLQRRMVTTWIDSVIVPTARLNNNVLSMKIATHNWGADSRDLVLISEYATWAAIEADCKACDDWFTAHLPKPGTSQRASWDAAGDAYRRANLGHRDEIYQYRVDRSK